MFQLVQEKNNDLIHQFNPDNLKEFEDWLLVLSEIIDGFKTSNNFDNTLNTSNNSQNNDSSPTKEFKLFNDLSGGDLKNFDLNKVKNFFFFFFNNLF